jgi:hypothetical protein
MVRRHEAIRLLDHAQVDLDTLAMHYSSEKRSVLAVVVKEGTIVEAGQNITVHDEESAR